MTKQELQLTLNSGRLSKKDVDRLVEQLLDYPEQVDTLLDAILAEDKDNTFNASWVFDNLMRKRLVYLLPSIQKFVSMLSKLQSESCIRPVAHVCQLVTEAYFKKKDPAFQKNISETQLDKMVTVCFDWLIGQHKVAAKVFAMTSLYYLGSAFDWVHPELKSVLEQTIAQGTAGYKNRAMKTLVMLKRV